MNANSISGIKLVIKFIREIFPEVDSQLKSWTGLCHKLENEKLSEQALSSIRTKKFHAQGGSIYALYPGANAQKAIRFIVPFQTISDYLDNLCDRAGIENEAAFRQLHLSMLDAVDPSRKTVDYYKFFPYKNDGGYLKRLVEECRHQVEKLPSYPLVIGTVKKYVQFYSDLQTYKHLSVDIREKYLKTWANYNLRQYKWLSWWEFSAAAGSTLGIYTLFSAANDPSLTEDEIAAIDEAYFPWVCGLHILLDYYIDAREDQQLGELNFTCYYDNLKQCEERLSVFLERALECCGMLRYPEFHTMVVKGLLAMYLSDPKAQWGLNRLSSKNLLDRGGTDIKLYHRMCKALRLVKVI